MGAYEVQMRQLQNDDRSYGKFTTNNFTKKQSIVFV